ncbi:MAG: M20/M25/M40 family metallo-hydrolase, partial [Terriglobales bacterium]
MDAAALFALVRQLVDIESTTGQEAAVVEFTAAYLRQRGWQAEIWPLPPEQGPGRANIFASDGPPRIVLSTHLDTVPPFFPSREDAGWIYGRGSCDAKGIAAAQIFAAESLRAVGIHGVGLLFLAGEEKNSAGACAANERARRQPPGSRFLINGEPTANRMVAAGKGALRVDIRAQGRAAHSAYPELGESAIDKLLEALARLRALPLPADARLGPTTCNIGTLAGGHAPNVVADQARAELLYRLVAPATELRQAIAAAARPSAEAEFVLELPPVFPRVLPGFETTTVAFTTDVPSLGAWGEPLLF